MDEEKQELTALTEMAKNLRTMIPVLEGMKELDVAGDAKKKTLELLTSIHNMTLKSLQGGEVEVKP